MAEIKTGIFAKNVQKRLSRAQEKVLQKLGKADETKDDHFDQAVQNFKRQETEGSRLQREMKAYLAAVKAMQQASMNLTESLHEVYEPDWHGKDDVLSIGKNCDVLWEDFHQKLVDSSLITLDTYLQQFPDLKIRVAKRSRKLIDYDSARHHLETIQAVVNRSDRKVSKAEDELKKAQKVFDELNVDLQDELPTLWDSRVGFYVNTFKNVTNLEAKFHREISVLCKQLYEVMTKLGEQHSDKMFTIQGAPSDSGPLRLSRAPSPPDSDSDESPVDTPNHMLAPASPGPPRPKSPSGQFKKGPPVPPPPKTPTKELHQEQIIDLFGGQFLPAATPSQPNERPGESLLDLDFDPFKPDGNTTIGQAAPPITQQLPWDLWTGNAEPAQPMDSGSMSTVGVEEDGGGGGEAPNTADFNPGFPAFPEQAGDPSFATDWAADFGSAPAKGDSVPSATEAAAGEVPATTGQDEAQGWPAADGWGGEAGEAAAAEQPQGAETAAAGDEVSGWDPNPQLTPNCDPCAVGGEQQEPGKGPPEARSWGWGEAGEAGKGEAGSGEGWGAGWGAGQADSEGDEAGWRDRRKSTPGLRITNEHGQIIEDTPEGSEPGLYLIRPAGREGFGSEYETTEEWGDSVGQNGGWASTDDELDSAADQGFTDHSTAQEGFADWASSDRATPLQEEKALASDAGFAADWAQPIEQAPTQSADTGTAFADPASVPEQGSTGDQVIHFGTDPFVEIPGEGGFESDPFAETPGGFASDPFAETQREGGGGDFVSDPFAETHVGGGFESGPFAVTQGGGGEVRFATDPFAETTGEVGAGWAADPFANNGSVQWAGFPAPSAETGGATTDSGSWQEVSDSSGFFSSGGDGSQAGDLFASFPGPRSEAVAKEGVVRRAHKEPDNSDLSEDEVANRRYGKLYQEIDTEKEEMEATAPTFVADFDKLNESNATMAPEAAAPPAETAVAREATAETAVAPEVLGTETSDATEAAAEAGEIQEPASPTSEAEAAESATSPGEEKPDSTVGSPVTSAEPEGASPTEILPVEEAEKAFPSETAPPESVPTPEEMKESPVEETPEKMPIPSVVIEPASSNEGDDDRDIIDISPTTISDNGVTADTQTAKDITTSDGPPGLPPGFLYKVETLHDFEAANSDELELKKGDVVLVVPTATAEDQDAGWLTGIKESEWSHLGASAHKGLFPENFTQRLE
uniref:Amphiphysin n=1 Tax=Oncorhynchus kisutch TaxID=8019 RepID=A0A8C7N8L6_ONCKI